MAKILTIKDNSRGLWKIITRSGKAKWLEKKPQRDFGLDDDLVVTQ